MNSMTKYRERDCEAFQKWRRRQRCRNILRGFCDVYEPENKVVEEMCPVSTTPGWIMDVLGADTLLKIIKKNIDE